MSTTRVRGNPARPVPLVPHDTHAQDHWHPCHQRVDTIGDGERLALARALRYIRERARCGPHRGRG